MKQKTNLLESSDGAAGDVVNIKTTVVHKLPLRSTVAGLGHTVVGAVCRLEEHDGCPVVGLVLLETT